MATAMGVGHATQAYRPDLKGMVLVGRTLTIGSLRGYNVADLGGATFDVWGCLTFPNPAFPDRVTNKELGPRCYKYEQTTITNRSKVGRGPKKSVDRLLFSFMEFESWQKTLCLMKMHESRC